MLEEKNYTPLKTPDFQPIICKRCGNQELTYVADYHLSTKYRIISFFATFFIIVFGVILLTNIEDPPILIIKFLIISTVLLALAKIKQYTIESQTHVRAICGKCGRTWTLKD